MDAYILNTPDEKMGSDVGAALRKEMLAAKLVPPPAPRLTPRKSARSATAPGGQQQTSQQPAAAEPG